MSKNDNESDAKVNLAPTSVGHSPPDPLLVCFKTVPPQSFPSSYAYGNLFGTTKHQTARNSRTLFI